MKKISPFALIALPLIAISILLSYFAYFAGGQSSFNMYEAVASLIFWSTILALIFLFPLRNTASIFTKYLRTLRGSFIFVSYLSLHMILYSLILRGILVYFHKIPSGSYALQIFPFSILLYPRSFLSILTGFGFYPSITLLIPPVYILSLSIYSISIAIIIAVLVVTNVMKVGEIRRICGTAVKSRSLVALPVLGVIGGATCCLSLPFLISLAAPTAAVIANSWRVYYVAYFLFPPATAVALKYNMDSTRRMASKLTALATAKKTVTDYVAG